MHIAVLDRKESVVEKLVKLINDEVKRVEAKKKEKKAKEVKEASSSSREGEGGKEEKYEHPLEIANDRGNTPLVENQAKRALKREKPDLKLFEKVFSYRKRRGPNTFIL